MHYKTSSNKGYTQSMARQDDPDSRYPYIFVKTLSCHWNNLYFGDMILPATEQERYAFLAEFYTALAKQGVYHPETQFSANPNALSCKMPFLRTDTLRKKGQKERIIETLLQATGLPKLYIDPYCDHNYGTDERGDLHLIDLELFPFLDTIIGMHDAEWM